MKTEDTGDVSSLNGTSAANPTATADSGAVQAMAPPPSQENGHVGPEKREHDESHNSAADDGPLRYAWIGEQISASQSILP